jgi:hypothetical protein
MVAALHRHIKLLREYAQKAFVGNDMDYGGEIVGKLRLLATKSRANTPLLIRLMRDTGIETLVTLGGPPIPLEPGGPILAGQQITLAEYMELPAIGIRVSSGAFVILTKEQFVRAWAEQTGAPHEDWTMDEPLSTILSDGIYIGGLHESLAELQTTVDTVIDVAERFFQQYEVKFNAA